MYSVSRRAMNVLCLRVYKQLIFSGIPKDLAVHERGALQQVSRDVQFSAFCLHCQTSWKCEASALPNKHFRNLSIFSNSSSSESSQYKLHSVSAAEEIEKNYFHPMLEVCFLFCFAQIVNTLFNDSYLWTMKKVYTRKILIFRRILHFNNNACKLAY